MSDRTSQTPSPPPADAVASADGSHDRRKRLIAIAGLVAVAAFVALAAIWRDVGQHVRGFQLAYVVAFIGYGLIAAVVLKSPAGCVPGRWRWWLLSCVALRVALLHTVPSDDTYRYVWEGRIQRHGYNPFAHRPDDSALESLRDADWERVNHPDYPTIYPPLAQAEFLAVAAVNPSIYAMKAAHVLFDVVTIALLAAWSRRNGRPPHRALLYGLCPLTLTAFGIDGHVDSLMLACLAGTGLAVADKRIYVAAVLLALAVSAKIVAVVLLGWLIARSWKAALLCVSICAAAYLPYASAGWGLIGSLVRFAGGTSFFGLLYPPLAYCTGPTVARVVGMLIIVAAAVWSIVRRDQFERHGLMVTAALIVVSPIVHFWYLTWVLVFLVLQPRLAWLVLSAMMVFYFEAQQVRFETGQWQMPAWAWYATYVPFVVTWIALKLRTGQQIAPPGAE